MNGNRIDNLDLLIAARDLIKAAMPYIAVYDYQHPQLNLNEPLPSEFIVVRPIAQHDRGGVIVDGTVEVAIYVTNIRTGSDNSQPNLPLLKSLTELTYATLFDAQRNGVFFNNIDVTLVRDANLGYFYNSFIISTKSINVKFYNN
jgi:hypothetical protein